MGAEAAAARPRVAVAGFGDPSSPGASSGVPGGIDRGLRGWGGVPVPISVDSPRALRLPLLALSAARSRSRIDAHYMPEQFAMRRAMLARRLRAAGPFEGVISLGADVALPDGCRYVLISDMTLSLARQVHPVFAQLSESVARRWDMHQRRIYGRAQAVCAASRWCADSVERDYGVPAERVHVVGFGANHDPPPIERNWASSRFLFVGREWERKNGPMLVRAFARLRDERPDAGLDLVGEHPPVDLPGIHGHGPLSLSVPHEREQVERLFGLATCFAMPSACEPFGIAYVEAARAGVPSIATSVGGTATAVGPGGVLTDPNEEALLDAMRRLCEPETARRLGEAARRHSELLSWHQVGGRLLRALDVPGIDGTRLPDFL